MAGLFFVSLSIKVLATSSPQINDDCAMYLQAGAMILSGKVPYRDFFDINPPLVFYLHTIPVVLADLLSISRIWVFNLVSLLLCILSCFFVTLLSKSKDGLPRFAPSLVLAIPLLAWVANLWGEFGQRQLYLSVWLVPFVLVRLMCYQQQLVARPIACLIGAFYGLALSLLPQYIVVNVLLELFWLSQFKRLRALFSLEIIAAACVPLFYAAVLVAYPEVSQPFLHHNLPLVAHGYAAYDWPVKMILLSATLSGVIPLVVLSLAVKTWLTKKKDLLFMSFLIWATAGVLAVLMQGKCYPNQLLPAIAGSICLWLVEVAEWQAERVVWQIALAIGLPVIVLIPFQSIYFENLSRQVYLNNGIRGVIANETKVGDKVAIFSLALPDSFPLLLEMHRTTCSPYFFLYPVKMLRYLESKASAKAETEFVEEEKRFAISHVCDAIEQQKPVLMLIQDTGDQLSVSRFLEQSERFRHLLTSYTEKGTVEA